MPPRTKTLFDALIRLSEPCSQSDLAARVGTTQNRIAQHFAWLRERHLVVGRKRTGIDWRRPERTFTPTLAG